LAAFGAAKFDGANRLSVDRLGVRQTALPPQFAAYEKVSPRLDRNIPNRKSSASLRHSIYRSQSQRYKIHMPPAPNSLAAILGQIA
jgi:hypothetical protein